MCLTELQAGSDVGRLTAKAVKRPNGTYHITGGYGFCKDYPIFYKSPFAIAEADFGLYCPL